MDVLLVEGMHHQEERLGDEGKPPEIHHLFELGIHPAKQIDILRTYKKRELVASVASHPDSDMRLLFAALSNGYGITECLDAHAAILFGEKYSAKIRVFKSRKGKRSGCSDRAVLGRTDIVLD